MVKVEKVNVVNIIKDKVDQASILLFVDFRGLTVEEITDFRGKLKQENANLTVYKNTLSRIALKDMNIVYPDELLIGPSGFVHSNEDPIGPAKVINEYIKSNKKLAIKGGFLDKSFLSEQEITKLAELPSKDALIQKLLGLLKAPITNFTLALSSPMRGLINVLNGVKEKKQEVKND
ncbi:50S ribosomal protein L10 [Candidatus Margulisiibacteriota bacterium]